MVNAQDPADVALPAQAVDASPPATPASEVVPALETNPAVRAALELPREEPADYLQAIGWLVELGRPELARPILEELTRLPLTDAQRAALVEEFGSSRMLQLARAKELAPAGAQFADSCMAAAAAAANDPRRLSQLVSRLTDASAEVRQLARNDLAAAGQSGVIATLEALARETDPARRSALSAAAADMSPRVVGPLLAMLSTNDPELRAEVGSLLQRLGIVQAVPLLPTSVDRAERHLSTAISRYLAGTPPFAADEDNRVELWHWNDSTRKLSAALYPADDARVIWLARLARALAQLRPGRRDYRQQAWLFGLEAAGLVGSPASPLSGIETGVVNDVLSDALEANYVHAAVGALNELGRRRDSGVLYTHDGQPSPLARALAHPDRRVRFAALRAIMAIEPTSPYPGSSRLPEVLAWFARGTAERRALVAMPTNLAATDLAGMLAAHQLDAEATNRGRDAVEMAGEVADLDMIFVDMDILAPGIRQVLFELRTTNPATGRTPIAILAADGRLEAAEGLAGEHDRMIAVPRPHSPETVARIVDELNSFTARDSAPSDVRVAEQVQAMTWLAQLLERERKFYDLHRAAPEIEAALNQPAAAITAVSSLARLGTPESQIRLLNFASQTGLPGSTRAKAAEAFRASVDENGLLLTTEQILAQYERYNASANADAETQQILGALLDAIESRRDALRPTTAPQP
jgi:hypothetical protein